MVEYLTSQALTEAGVIHGWFKRRGGVSPAPYESLNVKIASNSADSVAHTVENLRRSMEALDLDGNKIIKLHLVGGEKAELIKHEGGPRTMIESDGAALKLPGYSLAISVADCLPVLLADTKTGVIGVAHAGWAGAAGRVTSKTIELMQQLGAAPENIMAAIGPSICGRCYEVKDDVGRRFDGKHLTREGDKQFLDLWSAVETELKTAGVKQIENLRICTYERTEDWYSARKEGETGRFLAVVKCPVS